MKLLIATANKGKAAEFSRILSPLGIEVLMPADLGVTIKEEETGTTFAENAAIKANELYKKTGIATLADDSGLCIDAMEGEPGIYSARYGGDISYPERFEKIFSNLKGLEPPQRSAYFVCSICCILGENSIIEVSEKCDGQIGFEPSGGDGFGYDPIFYVGDKSFAQLSAEEKDEISHRGKAVRSFLEQLKTKIGKENL